MSFPIVFCLPSIQAQLPCLWNASEGTPPSGILGHPEDVLLRVGINVFQILQDELLLFPLCLKLSANFLPARLERVGNVLQEHQPKHNVFVLGCIQRTAEAYPLLSQPYLSVLSLWLAIFLL